MPSSMTPMMRQYIELKEKYPDCLLFFRLGDFYEMFFEDAKTASKELDLVLTGRDCGLSERAPMCGVPYHAVDNYIAKLIEKGFKVAVCEQMEDPALAKGLVERDVIRVITPGTVIEERMLEENQNSYIASVSLGDQAIGLSYADVSTGEFYLLQLEGEQAAVALLDEMERIRPREIIA
ncbi:MAG TPA: DNA mismatch repair protein MutS, partial [Clostridia bacterium]|nr:DNA mismatch repair protein MutS [Clostridia bacterium]